MSTPSATESDSSTKTNQKISPWGEILLEYEKERTAPQPKGERAKDVSSEIREKEQAFNPVTGQYRNKKYEQREKEALERSAQRSFERDQRTRTRRQFDIVTNADKTCDQQTSIATSTCAQRTSRPTKSIAPPRRDEDIISHTTVEHLPGVTYQTIKPGEEDTYKPHDAKPQPVIMRTTRDYSIISGRYKDHHEEKKQMEEKQILHRAAHSLQQQKRFDLLTAKYKDDEVEKETKTREQTIQEKRQQRHNQMIPPSVKARPEKSYDVTTGAVKDEKLYIEQDQTLQKRREARAARSQYAFETAKHVMVLI
eukprot:MONOS_7015.1-p1 / transcript=MONOS_7015.1 / gene=MONOS_7015 / organism=Monocercomonoides_exilis_PA203 / gene_product=unspecified product / transcript_product=unspecified product / location=Mono_scaffold00231:25244-27190(+) / protein_length=310 / sequence_SO=supercontig / SO=protein_coding / is_pseudo=false